MVGATPIFVDIDPETYTMDWRQLDQALTPRTRAIIPVHLYGQMADMEAILDYARQYKLFVIEDACQAHGAECFINNRWHRAGSLGLAGAFSFYPGKNLGAFGEAGAVTTHDPLLANRVRMLRDHGQREKYHHEMEGYNGRLDAIQAPGQQKNSGDVNLSCMKARKWENSTRTTKLTGP